MLNAKQELQLQGKLHFLLYLSVIQFNFNFYNELTASYKYGRWVSNCGRYFLFSSKPVSKIRNLIFTYIFLLTFLYMGEVI
jgi:hypothetical protein